MMGEQIVIRIDATYAPQAGPGDRVREGQQVCPQAGDRAYPTSGTVVSIEFDPEGHEFVIVVASDQTKNRGE